MKSVPDAVPAANTVSGLAPSRGIALTTGSVRSALPPPGGGATIRIGTGPAARTSTAVRATRRSVAESRTTDRAAPRTNACTSGGNHRPRTRASIPGWPAVACAVSRTTSAGAGFSRTSVRRAVPPPGAGFTTCRQRRRVPRQVGGREVDAKLRRRYDGGAARRVPREHRGDAGAEPGAGQGHRHGPLRRDERGAGRDRRGGGRVVDGEREGGLAPARRRRDEAERGGPDGRTVGGQERDAKPRRRLEHGGPCAVGGHDPCMAVNPRPSTATSSALSAVAIRAGTNAPLGTGAGGAGAAGSPPQADARATTAANVRTRDRQRSGPGSAGRRTDMARSGRRGRSLTDSGRTYALTAEAAMTLQRSDHRRGHAGGVTPAAGRGVT
jgi:hypothetical protein